MASVVLAAGRLSRTESDGAMTMTPTRRNLLLAGALAISLPSTLWAKCRRPARSADRRLREHSSPNGFSEVTESKSSSILPLARAWSAVSIGMTERQVLDLLGAPLARSAPNRGSASTAMVLVTWDYGYMRFDSDSFPEPFRCLVMFLNGRVETIIDPFDRAISSDGRPTVPKLLVPFDQAVFEHYPRFVDFRWTPSSGDPLVSYEVEVSTENIHTPELRSATMPYLAIAFSGKQAARWRVRARNSLGASDWSEGRTFRFNV